MAAAGGVVGDAPRTLVEIPVTDQAHGGRTGHRVTHRHRNSRGSGRVVRCVPGDGSQGVASIAARRRVPGDGVGSRRQIRSQVHAIELELHIAHRDIVGRVGGRGNGVRNGRVGGGCRDGNGGRRGVGSGQGGRGGGRRGRGNISGGVNRGHSVRVGSGGGQ